MDQYRSTLKQHSVPHNIKDKMENLTEEITRYRSEEMALYKVYMDNLEKIRSNNVSILMRLNELEDVKDYLVRKRKNIRIISKQIQTLEEENR